MTFPSLFRLGQKTANTLAGLTSIIVVSGIIIIPFSIGFMVVKQSKQVGTVKESEGGYTLRIGPYRHTLDDWELNTFLYGSMSLTGVSGYFIGKLKR